MEAASYAAQTWTMAPRARAPRKTDRQPTFIRAWRKHRGDMSQSKLVERLEEEAGYSLSVAQLSRIESGKQAYTQDLLEALAIVLRCSPGDLIMRDPTAPDAPWSIWDSLGPVQQRQALEIMQTLKKTGTGG
jgi:transcriptional regulator with XRE-family HTH domain